MHHAAGLHREADGFHDLLEDGEQHLFDLASARTARRETAGYLSAADARAFLQDARRLRLDAVAPPVSIVAQAYFRTLDRDATTDGGGASVPLSVPDAPAVPDPVSTSAVRSRVEYPRSGVSPLISRGWLRAL